jgi:mannonate dehydratase
MPDGSEALRFVGKEIALFDCLILERESAWSDYPAMWKSEVEALHQQMSEADKAALQANILAGLPGAEEAWSLPAFRQKLEAYAAIDAQQLRENLVYFLARVCPVAQGLGVVLTLHPDDPPRPIFGLPRIASTQDDFQFLFDSVPSVANGLCFCTGSLGARADNDMAAILAKFASRVHFLHLRNVRIEDHAIPETFHEADHLEGQADMVQIIALVLAEEARRGQPIPMRPDHGHRMLSDLHTKANPGYTAIGRLRGLAELRGVERALSRTLQ